MNDNNLLKNMQSLKLTSKISKWCYEFLDNFGRRGYKDFTSKITGFHLKNHLKSCNSEAVKRFPFFWNRA